MGEQLTAQRKTLAAILEWARQGSLLREGMTVVLAGLPNAGKSSLLNALVGQESAIVTDIPGTTRDLLREQIAIDGMPLHIIDTAGLRESGDAIEQEGIRRAWKAIERADRVLLLIDYQNGLSQAEEDILRQLPSGVAVTVVRNKIDPLRIYSEKMKNDNDAYLARDVLMILTKLGERVAARREHVEEMTLSAYMRLRKEMTDESANQALPDAKGRAGDPADVIDAEISPAPAQLSDGESDLPGGDQS